MTTRCAVHHSGTGFGRTLSGFSSIAETNSLQLLKAVEQTVDGLCLYQKFFEGLLSAAVGLREQINECEPEQEIDPDDVVADSLAKAIGALENVTIRFRERRTSAARDPRLRGEHEESVVTEYDRAIECAEGLAVAMTDLLVAIREHDADVDKERVGSFKNVQDLFRAMRQ